MKKLLKAIILVLSVLIILLRIFSSNLIISCEHDIPQSSYEAIETQAEGLYSSKLPLPAVYVKVTDYSEERTYYTIYYFPFGTVDMSYSEGDGYNIEKQLTNLS